MMRSTKVLGSPGTICTRLICVSWWLVVQLSQESEWLVVFRFGLGRGREARISREQRMHKRESERAQKKLFVAMDGWLGSKVVQSKRSRTGSLLSRHVDPCSDRFARFMPFFCLRNGEGITPVERTTTVRDDGITSSTAFRLYRADQ
jgi:hypothetical protein